MSCCGGLPTSHFHAMQARGAMCATCRPARQKSADPWGYPILCINGAPLETTIQLPAGECPRGRWPDADGRVRWWRLHWHGIPEPIRWWLSEHLTFDPAGCGCTVAGKRFVDAANEGGWALRLGERFWRFVGVKSGKMIDERGRA